MGREKTVKCAVCGAEFSTTAPNAKYCGDDCRRNGIKQINRAKMQKCKKIKSAQMSPQKKKHYTMYDILWYMRTHNVQYAEAVRRLEYDIYG